MDVVKTTFVNFQILFNDFANFGKVKVNLGLFGALLQLPAPEKNTKFDFFSRLN